VDQAAEAQLARALLAGETEAFERFVKHFRSKLFHYSWLMCGHREDAEEVAQETLLKVFENIDQLRNPDRVRAWVFRIARNACMMQRRRSVFAPSQELSLTDLPPGAEGPDAADAPDSGMLRSELRAVLDRIIAELPPPNRAVVLLRDLEELSTEETAQILDVSTDVVKTRLHRGRVAMRQKLECYLYNRCVEDEPVPDPTPLTPSERDELFGAWRERLPARQV
jgi:RNA polymerase sigma-70 factor, ECF subfamily